uniref:Uncharacterized protein n=1 Tax=Labrus bergylta TaxID=56723 RepID=A0A3Q3F6I0_9LABR
QKLQCKHSVFRTKFWIKRYADFGGGRLLVWGGISLTEKKRLFIIGGNLNVDRYQDEILKPNGNPISPHLTVDPFALSFI